VQSVLGPAVEKIGVISGSLYLLLLLIYILIHSNLMENIA